MALDVFYLLIVLAMIVGGVRIAGRLSAWSEERWERRMGRKRRTGKSERIDNLQKLAELRDSGSLSEEEFEAAKARVRRE
jgi:biopolymer transport protein ExbB/TolQ